MATTQSVQGKGGERGAKRQKEQLSHALTRFSFHFSFHICSKCFKVPQGTSVRMWVCVLCVCVDCELLWTAIYISYFDCHKPYIHIIYSCYRFTDAFYFDGTQENFLYFLQIIAAERSLRSAGCEGFCGFGANVTNYQRGFSIENDCVPCKRCSSVLQGIPAWQFLFNQTFIHIHMYI